MKIFLSTFLLLLFAGGIVSAQQASLNIVPAPNTVTQRAGNFTFSSKTKIYVDKQEKAAMFLLAYLKSHKGYNNEVVQLVNKAVNIPNVVVIEKSKPAELPEEGYQLIVTQNKVVIRGRDAGLLYGVCSFLQLLPLENSAVAKLPCLEIKDSPRFKHRGMMLDVARHFFTVKDVKKLIDAMAFYKLNTFHWHLTDNEGWRVEIKKYPKLTSIGAFRSNQVMFGRRELLDGSYGGFYTQQEIRDVVKYASDKFVTIIPEIDIPAHSQAALRAYPELKCQMPAKSADPGAYEIIFNPSEETFNFLEGVFTEIADLFPGKYIHVGGDEANKIPWKEAAFPQQLIKEKNLKDVEGLQSYFIQRIEKFLNSKGRQIIGWDEILEGGLAPNATVMSWRNEDGGVAAAKMGHDVIMVPLNKGLYFDFGQSTSPQEPFNIGGHAPLNKVYSYNPIPEGLPDDKKKHIIGVQANLWTEFIGTYAKVEYMLYPRLLALSETSWTQPARKDFQRFSNTALPVHLARLEQKGFNFRVPEAFSVLDTTMIGSNFNIELKHPLPGSKIFYTVNGLTPGPLDFEYKGPLTFGVPVNDKREIKAIVVTKSGERSLINTIVLHNRAAVNAVAVQDPVQGLNYQLFRGAYHTVDAMEPGSVKEKGTVSEINLSNFKKAQDVFGLIYDGYLKVDDSGVYSFSVLADDGMKLYIDDELVVNNDFRHPPLEKQGNIPLAKGFHKFRVKYFDAGEAGELKIYMRLNNGLMKPLLPGQFFYTKNQ